MLFRSHMNPVHSLETVGQFLRLLDVAQTHERVVELHVLDVVTIELPSQPLVVVDVDLNLAREPALELDVDEPQISNTCASPIECTVSDRSRLRRTYGTVPPPTARTPGPP